MEEVSTGEALARHASRCVAGALHTSFDDQKLTFWACVEANSAKISRLRRAHQGAHALSATPPSESTPSPLLRGRYPELLRVDSPRPSDRVRACTRRGAPNRGSCGLGTSSPP